MCICRVPAPFPQFPLCGSELKLLSPDLHCNSGQCYENCGLVTSYHCTDTAQGALPWHAHRTTKSRHLVHATTGNSLFNFFLQDIPLLPPIARMSGSGDNKATRKPSERKTAVAFKQSLLEKSGANLIKRATLSAHALTLYYVCFCLFCSVRAVGIASIMQPHLAPLSTDKTTRSLFFRRQ